MSSAIRTRKSRHVTTSGERELIPTLIPTPPLNILDLALGALRNRCSWKIYQFMSLKLNVIDVLRRGCRSSSQDRIFELNTTRVSPLSQRPSNPKVLSFLSSLPSSVPSLIASSPSHCVVTEPLHHRRAIASSPGNRAVAEPPDRRPQPNRPPRSHSFKKSQLYDDASHDVCSCIKNRFRSSSTISKKGQFWFLRDSHSLAFMSSKPGDQRRGQDDASETLLLCLHYLPWDTPPPRGEAPRGGLGVYICFLPARVSYRIRVGYLL